jgi:hypothetical protein
VASTIFAKLTVFSVKMEKVEEKLNNLEERLVQQEAQEERIMGKINSVIEEKIKKGIDLQKFAITQEVRQLKETQEGNAKELQLLNKASEDADREKRKSNLIFFKLPEKANADIKGRAKDDLASISKVCKEDLDIEPPKAVKTFRLGKFNKGKQDNARPIKVICQTEEESARVLKRLSEMRGEKNPKLENIFIVPDRPSEERQSYKKLRVELKRRQEAGEENLVIRKGKITERTEGRNQNTEGAMEQGEEKDGSEPSQPPTRTEASQGSDRPH